MKTIFKIMLTLTFLVTLIGFTSCEKEEPIQTYYITIKPEDWTINQNNAKCKITEFTTIDFNIVRHFCNNDYKYTIELYTQSGNIIPNDWYVAFFNKTLIDKYPWSEYEYYFNCTLNISSINYITEDFNNENIIIKIITKL